MTTIYAALKCRIKNSSLSDSPPTCFTEVGVLSSFMIEELLKMGM